MSKAALQRRPSLVASAKPLVKCFVIPFLLDLDRWYLYRKGWRERQQSVASQEILLVLYFFFYIHFLWELPLVGLLIFFSKHNLQIHRQRRKGIITSIITTPKESPKTHFRVALDNHCLAIEFWRSELPFLLVSIAPNLNPIKVL